MQTSGKHAAAGGRDEVICCPIFFRLARSLCILAPMGYNIDLHCHSFFSGDGVSSPEELIATARRKGLHGFALTDHNTSDGCRYLLDKGLVREDGQPVDDFLIIPGVEVTTAEGHLLCLGVILPYLKGTPAAEVCKIVHSMGPLERKEKKEKKVS